MRTALVGGLLFIMLIATTMGAHAYSCAIATPQGLVLDSDCDSVPDAYDNCEDIPNSEQQDANRNGRGDACDAIIEEAILQPDNHILPGETAHLSLKVINNREWPIRDVTITVEQRELGITLRKQLGTLPAGESSDVSFNLPTSRTAQAKDYPLTITSSFYETSGELMKEDQTIRLVLEPREGTTDAHALDKTVIDVFGSTDVDVGEATIIPIRIENLDNRQRTYHLAVNDLGAWGFWRIDPSADVTLAQGHATQATLYVQTHEWTDIGTKTIELTVTSENTKATIPIRIYVRGTATSMDTLFVFKVIILILLMLGIGLLGVLLMNAYNRRHAKHEMKREERTSKKQKITTGKDVPTKKTKTVKVERVSDAQRETYY